MTGYKKKPSPQERPWSLTLVLSLTIALFALEAATLYPYVAGTSALPEGWPLYQAYFYLAFSAGGIVTTAAAFYAWRRWGIIATVTILLLQIIVGQIFATGKPLEILMKAALIALIVTFSGTIWKKMV